LSDVRSYLAARKGRLRAGPLLLALALIAVPARADEALITAQGAAN